jgi:hypothetical protein
MNTKTLWMIDVEGNLVGGVKGRYREVNSLGFLIPRETIISFFEEK